MARVEHTCTGCVPIDASIIDVYVTLVETNKSVTNAEAGRTEAEAARVLAETQRTSTFATDHGRAVADHSIAQSDHATAGEDHTSTVAATNAATAAAAVANAKAELVQARLDTADADHTRAEGDHSTAVSDHSTASSDHTTAQSDHTTAGADHTRAESDHTTAASDHTASGTATAAATAAATLATEKAGLVQDKLDRADADHTRAESDHTTAVSDHGIAGTDHTTATGDHTTASADHTLAGADHTTAASDHTTAGSDHTLAASDHTTAAADHTQAQADHEVMAGYDTRLTAVEGDVTELEAKVTDIETDTTEDSDDEIRIETDGGVYVGKMDEDGGHFASLFVGTEGADKEVATKEDVTTATNTIDEKAVTSITGFSVGAYKIVSNSIEFTSIDVWRYKVFPVTDGIIALDIVASRESNGVAAAIFLSGASVTDDNYIGEIWAETEVPGQASSIKRYTGNVVPPEGTTHICINYYEPLASTSKITFLVSKFVELETILEKRKVISVDKNGKGDYTTINAAVAAASANDTIIIYPGTYEEVVYPGTKNLHLVGVCRETCILTNGYGDYARQPLNMYMGSVENMTIIADNYDSEITDPTTEQERTCYAVHIEGGYASPYTMILRNCTLISKWNAAVGLGLRYNQTVIIENCDLLSECVQTWSESKNAFVSMGALFFHNDAIANNNDTGILRLKGNRLYGVNYALSMYGIANKPYAKVEYIGNSLLTQNNGVTGIVDHWSVDDNGRILKALNSYGNNIAELNN